MHPRFLQRKEQLLKGNEMDLKKCGKKRPAEVPVACNICMAESFCSWSASNLYVCSKTGAIMLT